jgi:hypothetical protein
MLKKPIAILVLLTFFIHFGCGRMFNITKEDFTQKYSDKTICPSIHITTFDKSSYKIPADSYHLKSDTIYYDESVIEVQKGKRPSEGKFAIQDIRTIKTAGTDLLLAPVVFLVGVVVIIGLILLGVAIWGAPY